MIRAGVYGATGYTGFELVRLLQRHPQAEIAFATARAAAGQNLRDLYPTLLDQPLVAAEDADPSSVDVAFFCLPHGASAPIVQQVVPSGARLIDLSADFRLRNATDYQRWYALEHPAPQLLAQAVYGLPELYRAQLREARLVANPGCFPTSVILPLHPLVQAGLLDDSTVIADCKTGVSGAGRGASQRTHFCEVSETFSGYNLGRKHRHVAEMDQETGLTVIFAPHLLPVVRGILSTIYVKLKPGTSEAQVRAAFDIFADEPFFTLLPAGRLPELRYVQQTNHCVVGIQPVDEATGRYILVSVIDNLLKGASGQAVQTMNVMFGREETMGLEA